MRSLNPLTGNSRGQEPIVLAGEAKGRIGPCRAVLISRKEVTVMGSLYLVTGAAGHLGNTIGPELRTKVRQAH